ncbi:MAG: hypothetical protein ABL857_03670, partial [Rickettsiales bacterium]
MHIDERGTLDKITAGDLGAMDLGDAASAGQIGTMALGAVGKAVPLVGAINTGLAGVIGDVDADKERAKISQYFKVKDIAQLKRRSPAFRKKAKELDERWQGSAGGTAASVAGGAAVGALLMGIIPGGFIVGSIAGGFGGSYLYDKAFVKQAQDPVVINMQIGKMHEAGEYISPEVVFAALASNLSEKSGKMTDKLLKRRTGTKLFAEALADPKNMPKLAALMNDTRIDDAIRAQTGMTRDSQNPLKTVSEQYAELINSGQMKPEYMLKTGEGIRVLTVAMNNQNNVPCITDTPEMQQNSTHVAALQEKNTNSVLSGRQRPAIVGKHTQKLFANA